VNSVSGVAVVVGAAIVRISVVVEFDASHRSC
jgi:hypothetical protein